MRNPDHETIRAEILRRIRDKKTVDQWRMHSLVTFTGSLYKGMPRDDFNSLAPTLIQEINAETNLNLGLTPIYSPGDRNFCNGVLIYLQALSQN